MAAEPPSRSRGSGGPTSEQISRTAVLETDRRCVLRQPSDERQRQVGKHERERYATLGERSFWEIGGIAPRDRAFRGSLVQHRTVSVRVADDDAWGFTSPERPAVEHVYAVFDKL